MHVNEEFKESKMKQYYVIDVKGYKIPEVCFFCLFVWLVFACLFVSCLVLRIKKFRLVEMRL